MGHKMSEIGRLECLMNQDAVAERNLNLAQRVSRIIGFYTLARHDVMFLYP